jgi:6-phosphofructokinase 1
MPYTVSYKRIELSEVAAKTKHFPKEWIKGHNDIGEGFLNYARPLVGPLPSFEAL